MGRQQKDGPNEKQKSHPICLYNCTTFFHFFPELHFWRFTGHDGFLYFTYASFSLRCIPEREWAKAEEEEEQQRVGEMMRNIPCYIPL
jgi:hypothetical protein